MIKLISNQDSTFKNIESTLQQLSNSEQIEFFKEFIKNHIELNNNFSFNESINEEYIIKQVQKLQQIEQSKGEKLLSLIPFGIKDIFNTEVLPTSMGSKLWEGFVTGNNARVVSDIIYNGGIIFSKTTTAEFAIHFITPKKTLNPHNINHITGTSSSGSAVAVSCGALPISLGSQTAGSIIRPASFCGVYGFKPSFGAIDRTGVLKTNDTFDTIGLLSADIYGIKQTFTSIFQKGPDYPNSVKIINGLKTFKSKSRKIEVGLLPQSVNLFDKFETYVNDDFTNFLDLEKENINFSYLHDIKFLDSIHSIHEKMYAKSVAYYFKQEMENHHKVSEEMVRMINRGKAVSLADYNECRSIQPQLIKQMDIIFENHDFIMVPSTASGAPKIGEKEIKDTCLIWTFFGYPVLSIPLFYNQKLNLPFGLQIIGKKFSDLSLLDFAESLEQKYK